MKHTLTLTALLLAPLTSLPFAEVAKRIDDSGSVFPDLAHLLECSDSGRSGLGEVVAHGFGGGVGISLLEAAENAQVLGERSGVDIGEDGADGFAHGLHQIAVADDFTGQPGIVGGVSDCGVEFAVEFPVGVGPLLAAKQREGTLELIDHCVVHARRGKPGGFCLKQRAHGVEISQFLFAKGEEDRSAVAPQLDDAHGGEFEQGLTHRSAADFEQLGGIDFSKPVAAMPATTQQAVDDAAHDTGFASGGAIGGWSALDHELLDCMQSILALSR